jgi:hypothetical protein
MKLSPNEKMLAIALAPSKEQNAKIEIFDTNIEENILKNICSIDNLSASIEFLDFSKDDQYLLFKDSFEEVSCIDLANQTKGKPISIYIE